MYNFLFYLFAFLIISSSFLVIYSRNPIHSILFLILVFAGSSGLLLMIQADFLAMMFIVVYVGAIAVLFLFVIMMLNVKIIELNENLISYLPISSFIMFIFIGQVVVLIDKNFLFDLTPFTSYNNWILLYLQSSNIELIGEIIYTYFFQLFLITGVILLIAMIGPIVLTLSHTKYVLRQNIYEQNARKWRETVNPRNIII